MKLLKITLLAATVSAAISGQALAIDELHTFSANTQAKAQEVNENFQYLESQIAVGSTNEPVEINCTTEELALKNYLADYHGSDELTINVTGRCVGPVDIRRADVKIIGGTIYDGTDDDTNGNQSIFIAGNNNVNLRSITIEGHVEIARGASVIFDNVTLSKADYDDDEEEYLENVYVRSSNLRFRSGSLNNLSLRGSLNSNIRLQGTLTDEATQISLDSGSSLVSFLSNLGVSESIDIESNSTLSANKITVLNDDESMDVDHGGRLFAAGLTLAGELSIDSASIEVDGNTEVGYVYCNNGFLDLEGNLSLGEDEGFSIGAERGCHVDIEGTYEKKGQQYIDPFSSITDSDDQGFTRYTSQKPDGERVNKSY